VAAVAPQVFPGYTYPSAQAPATRIGGRRTNQVAVAGGLLAILIVVTVSVTALAIHAASSTTQHNCTSNCHPIIVTPLTASATYTSPAFGFEVDYFENWTVQSKDDSGILLGTRIGALSVVGMKAGQPLDQVIRAVVAALPSATWQSVTRISDLKGAEIGDQGGVGAIYEANQLGANSTAVKVRFAVIAATKGNVTIVVFAADPADVADFANGIPEGQVFDYVCRQIRWGG
jgi:hypothetical protein